MVLLLVLTLVVLTIAAFAAGYALALRRRRSGTDALRQLGDGTEAEPPRGQDSPPSGPTTGTPSTALALRGHAAVEPVRVAFIPDAAEGTTDWQHAMREVGAQMRSAGVRLVVFAHGSFVGDDPLAIARVLEEALPMLPDLGRAVRGFTRAQISRVLGDLSNFPREYIEAFSNATGIEATDFVWSGENHHAARIQGAVRLARLLTLHGGGVLGPGDRVLLVGHSHGGQLFALLSQLVARATGYEELVGAARARGEDVGALDEHVALLRRCALDVVTFGTPPRYTWAPAAGFRVLHLVNHRGGAQRASSLLGLLHTKRGDYVHHLGGVGSDFPASLASDRKVNARLDAVLGPGTNLRAWLRELARGRRVSPEGRTVLVDYGDGAGVVPNFLATGLGHAAYTRREAMLFHARLVARELYAPPAPAPWTERVRAWITPRRSGRARQLPPAPEA